MAVAYAEPILLGDFSGGLNVRDAPELVGETDVTDALNVTLTERGAAQKRLGFTKDAGMSEFAAEITNLFYSVALGQLVVQEGVNVRKRTAAGAFTLVKAFSTSARVGMCDFNGKLLMVHPVDGIFSYTTGAVLSARLGSPVLGNAIKAWKNKLWVVGDPSQPTRVWFSAPGDETVWTTAEDFNDVRNVDDAKLTGMGVTRAGLCLTKLTSAHRVTDPATGAYETFDNEHGAAGTLAVVEHDGHIVTITDTGIYISDGLSELVSLSAKLSPLFSPVQLAMASIDKFAGGQTGDRVVFSIRRNGKTENDLVLELDPRVGWIMPHSIKASCFATLGKDDAQLFHGGPAGENFIYETFTGGSDDGAAIASKLQSRRFEPNGGFETRIRRLLLTHRGSFDIYIKHNDELGDGVFLETVMEPEEGLGHIDVGELWDDGLLWGPGANAHRHEIYELGVCRSCQFLVRETSTTLKSGQPLLGDGANDQLGAWAIYNMHIDHIRLGIT